MKKLASGIVAIVLVTFVVETGLSQDLPKAKKMENTVWHSVVMVDYKPGKTGEALGIIRNHFMKAGEKSGTPGPSQMLEMRSGDWDLMLVWDMDDISDMNWEVSPENEKWWKALADQEGGNDKAMEVWQKYMDTIERSTSYIATSKI